MPDEESDDYNANNARPLPPEMGGSSNLPSGTARKLVERFLAMQGGKKKGQIVASGGPAPIDPAGPGRAKRKVKIKPPSYPVDPRLVRPAGPGTMTGVTGERIVGIAKGIFQDMFIGDEVMVSGNPQPIDPNPDKRKGVMAPPKGWNPYAPRVRKASMLLPDD